MTYGQVMSQFLEHTKMDGSLILDFRPAVSMFIHDLIPVDFIPNAIVVWLTNGSKLIYIAKEEKV